MSEFDLASDAQITFIKRLAWVEYCRDGEGTYNLYGKIKDLSPKNLLKGEASDLIDEMKRERPDWQYIGNVIEKALKANHDKKLATCPKCGDPVLSDDDALCGRCI